MNRCPVQRGNPRGEGRVSEVADSGCVETRAWWPKMLEVGA